MQTLIIAGILSLIAFIMLIRNGGTEDSSNINSKVREGNSCEIKKQVTLTDSKTGIEYTIAFCDDSCENGLPHTINETTMMIPESYSKDRFTTTVEHEKIHLLQRRHPELWEAWYKLLWSYTIHKTPPPEMPSSLLEKRRHNPDTEDKPFACWRGRWWSLAVYNSNPTSLLDAKIVWWDEKTGFASSEAPPEWTDFFGQQPQDEHPHEIAAQMIANGAGNKNLRERLTTVYEKHFYLSNRG
jgi:hypothetical protein